MDFINTELLLLIPVLYFIGMGLKNSVLSNKYIPLFLGGIGIFLACLYMLFTLPLDTVTQVLNAIFAGVTQGILCAGTAVYGDQMHKQLAKEDDND